MKKALSRLFIITQLFSLALHAQNVGIGTPTPFKAKLHVTGMVGNTSAIFGDTVQGISLVGNWPGVFFNSYFNNGVKGMHNGYAGNITLNEAANYYEFSFNDPVFIPDFDLANYPKMVLNHDGKLGINMSTPPTRAFLEQQGSIGTTAAIFGGDGAGMSFQKNWPAVGFNEWYDGSNHKSIAQGYSAQMGLNQVNGSLYLASWPFTAIANQNLPAFTQRFYISRFGRLGLGTDDPWTDVHIRQKSYNQNAVNDPTQWENGITVQSIDNNYWNISDGKIKTCTNVNLGILDPAGIIGELVNGCTTYDALVFQYNGFSRACIRSDGEFRQMSDARQKKDIFSLSSEEGLTAVMKLNPVKYNFLQENSQLPAHYGFLAQEVEKIFPRLVDELNGNKVLGYQGLIPVLTKAVQQQQQQIDELKKEVQELKQLILNQTK